MAGNNWPPLVPDLPGQEGKSPGTLPKIPSTDEGCGQRREDCKEKSKEKEDMLVAESLASAYRQLEDKKLQPVSSEWKFLCYKGKKMTVFQDSQKLDWNLMEVATYKPKDRVKVGKNLDAKALVGPLSSSSLCISSQVDVQKTVTMVKRRGKHTRTLEKKRQLENRSIFCGPKKVKANPKNQPKMDKSEHKDGKKTKAKKSKDGRNNQQDAVVSPEADLESGGQENKMSSKRVSGRRKVKGKKKPARKVPKTLDLSAKVVKVPHPHTTFDH